MFNSYSPQASLDRINSHIAELERMKQQITQPTNLTQNFQLAPNSSGIKYADNIEQVQKELIIADTPYFSKDMSILWLKKASGETKTYELKEIIEKDEKDLRIEFLMAQIEELKKGSINNESNNDNVDESNKSKKSPSVSKNRTTNAK